MRPLLCLLVGPLLALTGCSSTTSSDEPPPPEPTVDEGALAEGLAGLYAGDNPDAEDRREGACFAEELLGSTMPAALREGGQASVQRWLRYCAEAYAAGAEASPVRS